MRLIIAIGFVLWVFSTQAQFNRSQFESDIETLSSEEFFGRGYYAYGDSIAANWIGNRFDSLGLQKPGNKRYQSFLNKVNVFPSEIVVKGNRGKLRAGFDFLLSPESPSSKGKAKIVWLDSTDAHSADSIYIRFKTLKNWTKSLIGFKKKEWLQKVRKTAPFVDTLLNKSKGVVAVANTLTHSVTDYQGSYPTFFIHKEKAKKLKKLKWEFLSEYRPRYFSRNVLGLIEGKKCRDTAIVITAHYDHLGQLGTNVMFPGANDNASGVALMLELARVFKADSTFPYSLLFIAFAGEEIGLVGSRFFTTRPLWPLQRMKALLNLDLMAGGTEGVTAVNAVENPKLFSALERAKEEIAYPFSVQSRVNAQNSDHYWFSQKNVPALFVYARGGTPHYHDPEDKFAFMPKQWPKATPFRDKLFELMYQWVKIQGADCRKK